MDTVAAEAGVGKGTLFRRFGSREGLMAAVLNESETAWQALVISGPPPLGPGAPPLERLLAFGHSRLRTNLTHAELIAAAGRPGTRSAAAESFANMHVRYLLGELGNLQTSARLAWEAGIALCANYDFKPTVEAASQALTYKTLVANAVRDSVAKSLEVAGGPVQFNSVVIDVDETTGRARSIARVDRLWEP